LSASEDRAAAAAGPPPASSDVPHQWTFHSLNTGIVFEATCRGVAVLPRLVSHAIGDVGTWIAWKLMREVREAVAGNLQAIFPDASQAALERRALLTLRAYSRDVIDFLAAIDVPPAEAPALFEYAPEDVRLFEQLLSRGQGVVLASGHYGNWELGSVAMRHVFKVPLTVVAMAEASETINRRRKDIRDRLGVDTVEVRRSLDTALQIRKRLASNQTVALLMDRHVGRDRVAVTFLGRHAWFLRTPALMAYLSGAPLVPCFIERTGGGRFRIGAGEPIFVARDVPRDVAIHHAAQQFADQLGDRIRQHPQFWYQFYRYWDTQAGPVTDGERL
jgi:KDO2-lipid IV(A) lauroyltransferase